MVFETGAITVGGISIVTIIVQKLKFYVKKNGIVVKTIELGDVHVMYVKNKHHHEPHHEPEIEYEYEYENSDPLNISCFKKSPFE